MSPKRSAASQPEFFVDRSLGPSTTTRLRQLRRVVHLVNDHFEHDGQLVPDETWIEYGLQQGLRGWPHRQDMALINSRTGVLNGPCRGEACPETRPSARR
ncbi:MAG: hypothetical protein LC808_12405 [Actinobacteria bacterium]|nr:hypothetical protein [Actinomycetota bacterium]